MLSALLDGRALTASELAFAARITPQTASTHLAKLTEAGLLSVIRNGRNRYFRLASPTSRQTCSMGSWPWRSKPDPDTARCHVKHGNSVRREFATTIWPVVSACTSPIFSLRTSTSYSATKPLKSHPQVRDFLTDFGVNLSALSSTRRHFCRLCLDWTERRPHIAGALGAALTKRYFDLGWTERMNHSRAIIITAVGKRGFGDFRDRRSRGR